MRQKCRKGSLAPLRGHVQMTSVYFSGFLTPPPPVRIYSIEITQPPPPIVRNWLTPPPPPLSTDVICTWPLIPGNL